MIHYRIKTDIVDEGGIHSVKYSKKYSDIEHTKVMLKHLIEWQRLCVKGFGYLSWKEEITETSSHISYCNRSYFDNCIVVVE